MRIAFRSVWLAACVGVALVAASGRAALAQHEGHGSASLPDPVSAGQMTRMTTMGADRMMKKVDAKLASTVVTMRDLVAQHASMNANGAHDQLLSSLQGMLVQMRRLHGTLAEMTSDPIQMTHRDSMKTIEETGRDFERMAGAFQSIAKNIGKVMKETNGER